MVKVREDMTGWKMWEHGIPDSRIIIISRTDDYIEPKSGRHHARYVCKCQCGNDKHLVITASKIKHGEIKSCGCLMVERSRDTNKKYNRYDLSGDYGIGWTVNTNKEFYFDLEDYDKIKEYGWREHNSCGRKYCPLVAYIDGKHVPMSHLLGRKQYDHIDRNPLNNRKSNFRIATKQENVWNSTIRCDNASGFIGVSWRKNDCKWTARININNESIFLGSFQEKEDAIKARLEAEAKYFGEFAPQRHLFEQYKINVETEDV